MEWLRDVLVSINEGESDSRIGVGDRGESGDPRSKSHEDEVTLAHRELEGEVEQSIKAAGWAKKSLPRRYNRHDRWERQWGKGERGRER